MKDTAHKLGLFSRNCQFMIGATAAEHFPKSEMPEVAFIGRSNVGKSSLLNSLVRRKNLARTSQSPGRTRQINFFLLGEKVFLIDLPGYGFATASKKDIQSWNNLMYAYLHSSTQLRRIFLLVDSRRGLKDSDLEMLNFIAQCAVSTQIVLTKMDKINRAEREAVISSVTEALAKNIVCHPTILCCSSHTKEGVCDLQTSILEIIDPNTSSETEESSPAELKHGK